VKFYKPNQLQWADERTAKFLASVWTIAICDLRFAYVKLLKPKLKFRSTVWPPLLDLDPNPFLSGSGSRKSESIPVLIMIQIKDANIYGSAWIRIWNTANRYAKFLQSQRRSLPSLDDHSQNDPELIMSKMVSLAMHFSSWRPDHQW
jgi:hypothetical protein